MIQVKIRWLKIIKAGIKLKASDVYLLPYGKSYLVKIRAQDRLINYHRLKFKNGIRLINFCKFYGGMNISEHRRPQLGAMRFNSDYSLRLSTVGDYQQRESMVIRIISDLSSRRLNFWLPSQIQRITKLATDRGLILFAGPTGSGKTTTIYWLAKQLSQKSMVMTIEDPVEINEPSFLQLQVNQAAGMGYEQLLKVGLRHRPDVFIIGEIRDPKTAEAAIQAALSGHLVLSTVHAQSPLGVVERMRQLGVDDRYLRQTLTAVAYQRLIPDRRNQFGALLAILDSSQLWPQEVTDHSLKGWRRSLFELVKNQKISRETLAKYKNG